MRKFPDYTICTASSPRRRRKLPMSLLQPRDLRVPVDILAHACIAFQAISLLRSEGTPSPLFSRNPGQNLQRPSMARVETPAAIDAIV
jgi:hypothetical protein